MKILLISANVARTPYPVYPLGLSMVAAALARAGHAVEQFDFLHHAESLADVREAVKQGAPDLVGVSIRNIDNVNLLNEQRYLDTVRDIVSAVREETRARIVLGGSGFSVMPHAILTHVGADYGIVGEGEKAAVEFADRAERGTYPEPPCVNAGQSLTAADIPAADYDPDIMAFYLRSGNVAAVQTKRGCTHRCLYCTYPVLEGARIRSRNPDAVVDDMLRLRDEHGAGHIFFTDSVFNDEAGHFRAVIRRLEARDVCMPWTAFLKPTGLDAEIVARMKATGLRAAELGSDAPSDATLKGLAKDFRFADIRACNDLLHAHGIAVAHYFMFGGPGETPDTVREGIDNILSLKRAAVFIFMGIRILPGTPLAERAGRDGLITPDTDLLEPVYYLSRDVDREWLETTLTNAFAAVRHCVFPPDALDSSLCFMHQLGYSGALWDLLAEGKKRRRSKRSAQPDDHPCPPTNSQTP